MSSGHSSSADSLFGALSTPLSARKVVSAGLAVPARAPPPTAHGEEDKWALAADSTVGHESAGSNGDASDLYRDYYAAQDDFLASSMCSSSSANTHSSPPCPAALERLPSSPPQVASAAVEDRGTRVEAEAVARACVSHDGEEVDAAGVYPCDSLSVATARPRVDTETQAQPQTQFDPVKAAVTTAELTERAAAAVALTEASSASRGLKSHHAEWGDGDSPFSPPFAAALPKVTTKAVSVHTVECRHLHRRNRHLSSAHRSPSDSQKSSWTPSSGTRERSRSTRASSFSVHSRDSPSRISSSSSSLFSSYAQTHLNERARKPSRTLASRRRGACPSAKTSASRTRTFSSPSLLSPLLSTEVSRDGQLKGKQAVDEGLVNDTAVAAATAGRNGTSGANAPLQSASAAARLQLSNAVTAGTCISLPSGSSSVTTALFSSPTLVALHHPVEPGWESGFAASAAANATVNDRQTLPIDRRAHAHREECYANKNNNDVGGDEGREGDDETKVRTGRRTCSPLFTRENSCTHGQRDFFDCEQPLNSASNSGNDGSGCDGSDACSYAFQQQPVQHPAPVQRRRDEGPTSLFQASVYYASPFTPPRAYRDESDEGAAGDNCVVGNGRVGQGVGGPSQRRDNRHRLSKKRRRQRRSRTLDPSSSRCGMLPRTAQHNMAIEREVANRASRQPAMNYHRLLQQLLQEDEERERGESATEAATAMNTKKQGTRTAPDGGSDNARKNESRKVEQRSYPEMWRVENSEARGSNHAQHGSQSNLDEGQMRVHSARQTAPPLRSGSPRSLDGDPSGDPGRGTRTHRSDRNGWQSEDARACVAVATEAAAAATCSHCHHNQSSSQQQQQQLAPPRSVASMRYVVGLRQLLLEPSALEEEELDARVWARSFNRVRRWPSVWDRWQRRRARCEELEWREWRTQISEQSPNRQSGSNSRRVDGVRNASSEDVAATLTAAAAAAATDQFSAPSFASSPRSASTVPLPRSLAAIPVPGRTTAANIGATATHAQLSPPPSVAPPAATAAALSRRAETRERRHARRIGAMKVAALLIDALLPLSVIVGVPLLPSAIAVSGMFVLVPCAACMSVAVYCAVVKLHNACYAWNTWYCSDCEGGYRRKDDRSHAWSTQGPSSTANAAAFQSDARDDHYGRNSSRHHHSNDSRATTCANGSSALSGGWLLTTQSLLDLVECFGGRWHRGIVTAIHATVLVAAAVLMLSNGVLLTGGSLNMLSFLIRGGRFVEDDGGGAGANKSRIYGGNGSSSNRHERRRVSDDAFPYTAASHTGHYAVYGCELYPREHLLPLFPPLVLFLLFAGVSTPLRWARYVAYWDTALFKLCTLVGGLCFTTLVVGVHLCGEFANRFAADPPSRPGANRVGYPFIVKPRDVARGVAPALLWLHSWDDSTHWLWRHFTHSLELDGRPAPTGIGGMWAASVDFTALHLSVSTALLMWLFGFIAFTVRVGSFHFFAVPLLWRGRQQRRHAAVNTKPAVATAAASTTGIANTESTRVSDVAAAVSGSRGVLSSRLGTTAAAAVEGEDEHVGVDLLAVVPSSSPTTARAAAETTTGEQLLPRSRSARGFLSTMHRAETWSRACLWQERRRWRHALAAFAHSGFGHSVTIALSIVGAVAALIALALFMGTPLFATNLAAPLHLRLLWTAVVVQHPGGTGTTDSVEGRDSVGENDARTVPPAAAIVQGAPTMVSSGVLRPDQGINVLTSTGQLQSEALLCDLGIQSGLPRPMLVINALASLLLGVLCCAWVPFFLLRASSAIASAPHRGGHPNTPQQLLEASLSAFMRSRWAVALRETPGEVRAYLAAPPRGGSSAAAVTTSSGVGNGSGRARANPRGDSILTSNHQGRSDSRFSSPSGIADSPSSDAVAPRSRQVGSRRTPTPRARAAHAEPLRSVPPHQLFRQNSAFMLFPELHRATTRTGVPIRIDRLHQYLCHSTQDLYHFNNRYFFHHHEAGDKREIAEDAVPPTSASTANHITDPTNNNGVAVVTTAMANSRNHLSSFDAVPHRGVRLCRRLFAFLLVPSSRMARDGFAVRAWALITEFVLLRLPFLVLVFILSAVVIAGPTARCKQFWSLLSLMRAWGHYDGVYRRSASLSLAHSTLHVNSQDERTRMCEEPMLISIDETITSRILLAAASVGGLLLAPLTLGVPVLLILRSRMRRQSELRQFYSVWRGAAASLWQPRTLRVEPSSTPHGVSPSRRGDASVWASDREDAIAGGLAGARFFAQQQQDARHDCATLRRSVPLASSRTPQPDPPPASTSVGNGGAANGNGSGGDSRLPPPHPNSNHDFPRSGLIRACYALLQGRTPPAIPGATAAALRLPASSDVLRCRCESRTDRYPSMLARANPPDIATHASWSSSSPLPSSAAAAASSPHPPFMNGVTGAPGYCGFCMARHRRWWEAQRRLSRLARSDPRVPAVPADFYRSHLYARTVTAQEDDDYREKMEDEEGNHHGGIRRALQVPRTPEAAYRGEADSLLGSREDAEDTEERHVYVPVAVGPPSSASLQQRRRNACRTSSSWRRVARTLCSVAWVMLLIIAWALAVFGAIRSVSLLY